MVQTGAFYLKTVPQVDGLGWGDYFPDKEFLFHQLTALGYRLAGDQGVIYASMLCSIAIVIAFFLFAASSLPTVVAFAITAFAFFTPTLLFRLMLVRPHCLAVLTFVILTIGVLQKRKWVAGVGALLFALSYHAFYLAVICFAVAALISWFAPREERKERILVVIAGFIGLVVGLVVNPHFPSNLVSAWEIAQIPGLMQGGLSNAQFGNELYPATSDVFLLLFWVPLSLLAFSFLFLGFELEKCWKREAVNFRLLYLSPLTLVFAFLCFKSPRAGEYLIPLAGFLGIVLLEQVKKWDAKAYGLLALAAIGPAWYAESSYLRNRKVPVREWVADAPVTLSTIPKGKKIYNCEWDSTPALYYHRPDLRFLDILDPSLLYFARPQVYFSHESVRLGTVADIHGLMLNAFKADYALCVSPPIVQQMEMDPGFRRIYPSTEKSKALGYGTPVVLEVRKERAKNFVQDFLVQPFSPTNRSSYQSLAPKDALSATSQETQTHYLNLFSTLKPKSTGARDDILCALVSPNKKEIEKFQGSEFVVLGGGRNLRLWWNNKPLYSSHNAILRAQATQVVVPLPSPLGANDSLQILVCSSGDAPFWGASISLWKTKEMANLCAWKREGAPQEKLQFSWKFLGQEAFSCLGPLAAPLPEKILRMVQ